jgi:hypothetical protein
MNPKCIPSAFFLQFFHFKKKKIIAFLTSLDLSTDPGLKSHLITFLYSK